MKDQWSWSHVKTVEAVEMIIETVETVEIVGVPQFRGPEAPADVTFTHAQGPSRDLFSSLKALKIFDFLASLQSLTRCFQV